MLAFRSTGIAAVVAVVAITALPSFAKQPQPQPRSVEGGAADEVPMTYAERRAAINALYSFQDGPLEGDLGEATIKVPAGYLFAGKAGADKWMLERSGVTDSSRGLLTSTDYRWVMMFTYNDTGHIPDDVKDELNADDLLKLYQEDQKSANEHRQRQGNEPLFIDGWEQPPAYNDKDKVLEWAIKSHSASSARMVNFNTRLLGRTGVMRVVLMFEGDVQLKDIITEYRALLAGFAFKNGQSYSEFRDGDKLAEYGLAALMAGGAVAVAAKTGLLAKFGLIFAKAGKLIFVALAAAGVVVASRLKRFFVDKG